MISARKLAVPISWALLAAPLMYAQDFSNYRGFDFGMNLPAVAKQADMKPSEARVLHQRPAMIQELEWRTSSGISVPENSVENIVFSFYNGELFRMVVHYNQDRTKGLTDQDMVEAISVKYGAATKPLAAKISIFSSSSIYSDTEKVLARWEDSHYSFNLFRSYYRPAVLGMLILSKDLDVLAQAAIVKSIQMNEQDAPQREIDRQKKQDNEERDVQKKARLANKGDFRP